MTFILKHTSLIAFLILPLFHFAFGQHIEYFNSENYKASILLGEKHNGVRIGKWVEKDSSGVIYGEYYYDSIGNPVDTWIIYMPKGLKRFETEYSDGKIIRTTIYRNGYKIAEIIPDKYFSKEIYSLIRAYDDSVFNLTVRTLTSRLNSRDPEIVGVYVYNYFEIFMRLAGKLNAKKFEGSLIGYNLNGTIGRTYLVDHKGIYKTSLIYSSSEKKLRKQIEYQNDSVVKTVYYNRRGEIKNK